MASVMVIGSEVFGSCVGEIDVSAEVKNSEAWLCCGRKHLRCFGSGESVSGLAAEVGDGARYLKAFWVIWE